jgi:ABC-type Fe3+ transport system permease subunit
MRMIGLIVILALGAIIGFVTTAISPGLSNASPAILLFSILCGVLLVLNMLREKAEKDRRRSRFRSYGKSPDEPRTAIPWRLHRILGCCGAFVGLLYSIYLMLTVESVLSKGLWYLLKILLGIPSLGFMLGLYTSLFLRMIGVTTLFQKFEK